MSFYDAMDRPVAALVSLGFSALFAIAGCGDASTPRIDGPGAHQSDLNQHDAAPAPEGGGGFQDPKAVDGGCSSPNQVCNGVCTAVDSDPANCGACGNACMGGDSICLAGNCACGTAGMDYCDGVGCMDVSSDFNNCGACGHACDPNNDQACSGGVCVPNDP